MASDKFRRNIALFTLPPVVAGAVGVAAGCAGVSVFDNVACDPILYQRHDKHVEEMSTSTGTASADMSFSLQPIVRTS